MFMQMRGRSRSPKSTPCPCGNKCLCHIPVKWKSTRSDKTLIYIIIICLLGLISMAIYSIFIEDKKVPLIEVNGQMCEIHYKETGHMIPVGSIGHNVAICPKDK